MLTDLANGLFRAMAITFLLRAVDACKEKLLAHGFKIVREQQVTLTADEAGEYLGVAPTNAGELAGCVFPLCFLAFPRVS